MKRPFRGHCHHHLCDSMYEYGLASAPRSRSCCRQCRKNPIIAPQTTPATGLGRPHDVRKGVIRRHGGRLSRCSIQRVRMGLRATDGAGGYSRRPDTSIPATKTARVIVRTLHCMFMAGQLLHAQRRGADSAGNTRPLPPTPRLPGLRRGSHNARRSTEADCWPS